mmetsp:Transcript_13503/g.11559  ORF Transcript_13503/g.11559 Transcript_13503/m.11559 type:complete len:151 (+) Transcript_13503:489-941(+)
MLNLGDAEILTKYTTKTTFIFHVTSYQMSICLLFEDRDTITIEEIKALLNMTDNEIYASLQNICTTKLPIFSRENGAEEDFTDSEKITLNLKFTSNMKKINCRPSKVKGGKKTDEEKAVEKDVLKEREFLIDAAIIRVMKSRRALLYNDI